MRRAASAVLLRHLKVLLVVAGATGATADAGSASWGSKVVGHPIASTTTPHRLLRTMLAVVVCLVGLSYAGTTLIHASTFAYDVPATKRGVVHGFAVSDSVPVQFSGVQQGSVPPSVSARAPSTTPSGSVIATNTATSSIDDLLQPGGSLIGKAGTDVSIREIPGGLPDAQAMFQQLSRGGTIVEQTATLTRVQLPNGGFVQLRTVMARSPATAATIDVNIPGLDITKLKFNP